jgi:2,4-dienoyl-CoA reductase (NADPH2)
MAGKGRFEKLLEPGTIGKVRTRNRMIKTGAGTSFLERDGTVGEAMIAFYETVAKGGVGLIIVESCGVDFPLGVSHIPVHCHMEDDKYIPSYSELTAAMHKHGCPTFLQLFHAGPWHPKGLTGLDSIASSALSQSERDEVGANVLKELTIPETEEVIDKFARAAERARKAGFDGVEINANSSHLINTFLSPLWNKRKDAYGCGDMTSRARFLVEIIQQTKKRTGEDFAVSVLMTGAEHGIKNGITLAESCEFARMAQDAGADAIQTRGFGYKDHRILHPGPERVLFPEPPKSLVRELDWSRNGAGAFVPLAEATKRAVSIPVIAVGRLDPELGEEILEQGKADFIGLHRRLLADPELPNKVAAGRLDDIAPCTACYYCWNERINGRYIRCRQNASLGREREYAIRPAAKKKRVMVVGGGPAGMEAARVAALRGHDVTIYEKESRFGGSLLPAAMLKGFEIEDMTCVSRYLENQIRKLGVRINLGVEVTASVVTSYKPDVVILATGGTPAVPDIPGIHNRHVMQSTDLQRRLKALLRFFSPRTLRWLTKLWMPVGKDVVIIGSGVHGCQLAEFLIKRNRNVTIVDTAAAAGEGLVPPDTKERLLNWLTEKGVVMMNSVRVEAVNHEGLILFNKEGERKTLRADTILTALPLMPDKTMVQAVAKSVAEVYQIGDCREPHLTAEAVADGARIAHQI